MKERMEMIEGYLEDDGGMIDVRGGRDEAMKWDEEEGEGRNEMEELGCTVQLVYRTLYCWVYFLCLSIF